MFEHLLNVIVFNVVTCSTDSMLQLLSCNNRRLYTSVCISLLTFSPDDIIVLSFVMTLYSLVVILRCFDAGAQG